MSTLSDASASRVRLLSASEFAAAIGKTERQVYRYVKKGRVAALSPEETGLPGVRIPESELAAYAARFGGPETTGWARPRIVGPPRDWNDSVEDSLDSDVEAESAEGQVAAAPPALVVPLERHEAAVMRLGYLESQLEQTRTMLTDGGRQESDLRLRLQEVQNSLHSAEADALRAQVRAEVQADLRAEAESRARALAARLEEAERRAREPWWRRLFQDGR